MEADFHCDVIQSFSKNCDIDIFDISIMSVVRIALKANTLYMKIEF